MDVGKIISGIRTQNKLSLGKLAKLSGVASSVICRWETGEAVPRIDVFQNVLSALGYKLQIVKIKKAPIDCSRCKEPVQK